MYMLFHSCFQAIYQASLRFVYRAKHTSKLVASPNTSQLVNCQWYTRSIHKPNSAGHMGLEQSVESDVTKQNQFLWCLPHTAQHVVPTGYIPTQHRCK